MAQKYITIKITKPKIWDSSSVAAMNDIKKFNKNMNPGLILEAHKEILELQINHLNIKKLEKATNNIKTCKILGKIILDKINSIKSYGYKAGFREYIDYNKERKVINRKIKSVQRLQKNTNKSIVKTNALPSKYANKMLCGDSEKLLKKLPDNCIDIVFTSPPYNFGLDYENKSNDADVWDQYFNKLFAIFDECIRVLKHGGRLIVNVQPLFSDYIPTHHRISEHMRIMGLLWKAEIIWEKNNYNCKYTAWGSWKSPSSPYLKYTWEFVEVFCKGSLKHEGLKENSDITADNFKKWVNAKWSIAPEKNMKEMGHPAMFPKELAKRAIQLFSFKGDTVLDPFAGVGTTCIAAKATHRTYLGIDISQKYVNKFKKRLTIESL